MKHLKSLVFSVIFMGTACYAQDSGMQNAADALVSNVTEKVELSPEQVISLQNAAAVYVASATSANAQYATNDSLLIVAKKQAWREYQMAFRQILTEMQYTAYMQQQQIRQQEIINQIKQNQ